MYKIGDEVIFKQKCPFTEFKGKVGTVVKIYPNGKYKIEIDTHTMSISAKTLETVIEDLEE